MRRLRGRIATELAGEGSTDPRDLVRLAVLTMESDLAPDPDLLLAATSAAMQLGDLRLAEMLAIRAVAAGGGLPAKIIQAMAITWQERGADAEVILAELAGETRGPTRAQIAILRAMNFALSLGDTASAESELDEAIPADDEAAQAIANALRAVIDLVRGHSSGRRSSRHHSRQYTGQRHRPHVVDLGLGQRAGRSWPHRRDRIGGRRRLPTCREIGRSLTSAPAVGRGASYRIPARGCADVVGRDDRTHWARHDRRSVSAGVAQPFRRSVSDESRRSPCGATDSARSDRALGKRRRWTDDEDLRAVMVGGRDRDGRQTSRRATGARGHRSIAKDAEAGVWDLERFIAEAWTCAAEGATSQAISILRDAAATESERGRPAWEVMLLQTATQFGDHTTAARLAELAGVVQGPRAPAAAAHAAALTTGSGDALVDASRQYEAFGDRIAAADAAAHAVVAYRDCRLTRRGDERVRHRPAARTECQGAQTPALRAATPQPFTARQREIIALAAQGLSNKEVADRLTMSIRSVEGHLFRASQRVGANSREQLISILRGH